MFGSSSRKQRLYIIISRYGCFRSEAYWDRRQLLHDCCDSQYVITMINLSRVTAFVLFYYNIVLYCLTCLLTKHLRRPGKQKII